MTPPQHSLLLLPQPKETNRNLNPRSCDLSPVKVLLKPKGVVFLLLAWFAESARLHVLVNVRIATRALTTNWIVLAMLMKIPRGYKMSMRRRLLVLPLLSCVGPRHQIRSRPLLPGNQSRQNSGYKIRVRQQPTPEILHLIHQNLFNRSLHGTIMIRAISRNQLLPCSPALEIVCLIFDG